MYQPPTLSLLGSVAAHTLQGSVRPVGVCKTNETTSDVLTGFTGERGDIVGVPPCD
jgi:hypothetical protein